MSRCWIGCLPCHPCVITRLVAQVGQFHLTAKAGCDLGADCTTNGESSLEPRRVDVTSTVIGTIGMDRLHRNGEIPVGAAHIRNCDRFPEVIGQAGLQDMCIIAGDQTAGLGMSVSLASVLTSMSALKR